MIAPRERKTWIRPLPPLELPTLRLVQAVESGAGRYPAEARIAELFREGEAKGALQQRELEENSQEEAASERGWRAEKNGRGEWELLRRVRDVGRLHSCARADTFEGWEGAAPGDRGKRVGSSVVVDDKRLDRLAKGREPGAPDADEERSCSREGDGGGSAERGEARAVSVGARLCVHERRVEVCQVRARCEREEEGHAARAGRHLTASMRKAINAPLPPLDRAPHRGSAAGPVIDRRCVPAELQQLRGSACIGRVREASLRECASYSTRLRTAARPAISPSGSAARCSKVGTHCTTSKNLPSGL